ncbi:aminoglycoside phosphotransferase family protein [Vibrio lamellibrachiae]|uniref:phosphotransferase n=1 Tax=Vibrio lamellibrachiae TaxID=2910253 RepID=UPI003D11C99E
MFLIMSGAYVGQELESEFGKIPPSFLPLGNRRLFQHQVALAPQCVDIYLSIPESFDISNIDLTWLNSHHVTVIPTPDGLNLGASLVAALNISGHSLDQPLHILYGDTLYKQLPTGEDIASISQAKDSYNWAVLTDDTAHWLKDNKAQSSGGAQKIIDGYFKFSNPRTLIKNVTQSEWDFIEGLNRYHQEVGLTAVESGGWLDFGHVNTYYRSKAEFTTQRAFNELTITSKWIEKSSVKNNKIAAEANWFAHLPFALRGNIPQYLGCQDEQGKISYRLEYLHLTALNELFVFSKLPSHIWTQILASCVEFLVLCKEHKAPPSKLANSLDVLFSKKTEQRLAEYCKTHQLTLTQEWSFNSSEKISLEAVLNDSQKHLPTQEEANTVLHGDFCFSNVLYDFRAVKIKVIDPRGMTPEGRKTIYGDLRYDIAKLSHSVLGLYDWIIAGYYQVEIRADSITLDIAEEGRYRETQQSFIQLVEDEFKLSAQNLYAMQIQLFLSMLPLHADDPQRQQALFANAFRLHQILVRLEQ